MTDTQANTTQLTIIKGGKLSEKEFLALPFTEKVDYLKRLSPKAKLDMITADPEGKRLTCALIPQELFWTIKEIGEQDAMELIDYASPEQIAFFLDMEVWIKWSYSRESGVEWLERLLECGEAKIVETIPQLDQELLLLMFRKEIEVGGGVGELVTDEERLIPWDHSFDNIYFITFLHKESSHLVAKLLDILFRRAKNLYLGLMEGVKNEMDSELEDQAFRFRSGRLADLGFPELDDALAVYAPLDPASFAPAHAKEPVYGVVAPPVPVHLVEGTLLERILSGGVSETVLTELNYLLNAALVAEEVQFSDTEAMTTVFQRVYGYLNIALEYLSEGDETRATEIINNEYLKRLFQLGFGLVTRLRHEAKRLRRETDDFSYASGKVLEGLSTPRPRFYRGLDPDNADAYREFRSMADVRVMEEFLRSI